MVGWSKGCSQMYPIKGTPPPPQNPTLPYFSLSLHGSFFLPSQEVKHCLNLNIRFFSLPHPYPHPHSSHFSSLTPCPNCLCLCIYFTGTGMYFEASSASMRMGNAVSEDWSETEPCNFDGF